MRYNLHINEKWLLPRHGKVATKNRTQITQIKKIETFAKTCPHENGEMEPQMEVGAH